MNIGIVVLALACVIFFLGMTFAMIFDSLLPEEEYIKNNTGRYAVYGVEAGLVLMIIGCILLPVGIVIIVI